MGTSNPKPNSPPNVPLIPPWADKDPPRPEPLPDPIAPPDPIPDPAELPMQPAPDQPLPPIELVLPRRFKGFRTALGRFANSGDRNDARKALGHWARASAGGSRTNAVLRVSRATRIGGAALAGFARAAAGQPPVTGALDIRSLTGLPVNVAVDRIVDAFCPPGILDEFAARIAIGEALIIALSGVDTFDPDTIDGNTVREATLAFVAELVFTSIAGDGGQALAKSSSLVVAAQRESDIRSLVHEVCDIVGTPILTAAGDVLTSKGMSDLVSQLIQVVQNEMESW